MGFAGTGEEFGEEGLEFFSVVPGRASIPLGELAKHLSNHRPQVPSRRGLRLSVEVASNWEGIRVDPLRVCCLGFLFSLEKSGVRDASLFSKVLWVPLHLPVVRPWGRGQRYPGGVLFHF